MSHTNNKSVKLIFKNLLPNTNNGVLELQALKLPYHQIAIKLKIIFGQVSSVWQFCVRVFMLVH